MKIGSLFSGYGGLDLAVQAVFPTAEPAWFVEVDPAPSKILQHHYPNIPNFGDVTTINWEQLAHNHPIDILTGGYPCQPFSQAGKRKGVHDERHLWPHVRRAIRHLRPRFTFLENVAGHRSLGFDRVLADMAKDGLHARWCSLRASDVGGHTTANEYSFLLPTPTASDWKRADSPGDHRRSTPALTSVSVYFPTPNTMDHLPARHGSAREKQLRRGNMNSPKRSTAGNLREDVVHEPAERYLPAIKRWEEITRPAPPPTVLNKNGKPQLNTMFTEWLMGLPEGWVTSPDIGLTRAQQLKALGNGVVPQQAAHALKLLLEQENHEVTTPISGTTPIALGGTTLRWLLCRNRNRG